MGVAIASGVPPALGLVTAVVGGIFVGALGGAPLQISGPSAGLTVLVMQMHSEHGMQRLAAIILIAGLAQLGAGIFKVGRQFQAVSPAVVRGMLTGIGILIIAGQFHVMIDDKIHGSGLQNLLSIPEGVIKAIHDSENREHDLAALIGITTLLTLVIWAPLRKRYSPLRVMPGPLLGAILGAVLAWIFDLEIHYVAVPERLMDVLTIVDGKTLGYLTEGPVLGAGLALAFVASAETLLCATAVSRMHDEGRTQYDRELAVHGVANVLCGAIGVLPLTGAISRSTANVEAGARSGWSAILHAVWIATFVMLLPDVLALVPRASLAAILIYVGFKLLNYRAVRALGRFGVWIVLICAVTTVGVVVLDLLTGIVVGLVLSVIRLLYIMSHADFSLVQTGLGQMRLDLHGSATFLAVPNLADVLEQVPAGAELHVQFTELEFIDHACLDYLSVFREQHERTGGSVIVEWSDLYDRRVKSTPIPTMEAIAGPQTGRPGPTDPPAE